MTLAFLQLLIIATRSEAATPARSSSSGLGPYKAPFSGYQDPTFPPLRASVRSFDDAEYEKGST